MPILRQNFTAYFRTLLILFGALLMGQLAMLGVFYFVPIPVNAALPREVLKYYVPAGTILLIGLAWWVRQNRVQAARAQPDLLGKFRGYRLALVLSYALLEIALLVPAVVYFISRDPSVLMLAALPLAVFIFMRPDRTKLIAELDLSQQEQMALEDPGTIVSEQNVTRG